MSSTGAARTKSRDSGAWVAYPAVRTASHVQRCHHHRAVKGTVMPPAITSEVVVAYAQCPRKAYFLLFGQDKDAPHEYVQILAQQQQENHARYLDHLRQKHTAMQPWSTCGSAIRAAVFPNPAHGVSP